MFSDPLSQEKFENHQILLKIFSCMFFVPTRTTLKNTLNAFKDFKQKLV